MTLSYHWLQSLLPYPIAPLELSEILTSIGLEVERLSAYENIKGGLEGLVVGEVVECLPHPNADKLKLTKVVVDAALPPLQIVCGAINVGLGQKVVVAKAGTTIYPTEKEPITIRNAEIRKVKSEGMLCAEDEIGMGIGHEGIIILPNHLPIGLPLSQYFNVYKDTVFEIGLTPNRMDAMSHYGVARDVLAYINHHYQKNIALPALYMPTTLQAKAAENWNIVIENAIDCLRYCGVVIKGIKIEESPNWLKNRLAAIGVKPINNVVDITNYILHETGQPLHAFDYSKIEGSTVKIKNLPNNTLFIGLDDKEKKLLSTDLMITDSRDTPLCMAGIFGGNNSGITAKTKDVFLEAAYFSPTATRKSSIHHHLRTEAALRFEKGVDISNVLPVLKKATELLLSIAGGSLATEFMDIYPNPAALKTLTVRYAFIQKLSGKDFAKATVHSILENLGFRIINRSETDFTLQVPLHKSDIANEADIVEEILRIDGLNNIEMPTTLSFIPQKNANHFKHQIQNRIAALLIQQGAFEIYTNSITNAAYYPEKTDLVPMLNSLNVDLNTLRPSLLETGLEVIAFNINRKNANLFLFEIGKVYSQPKPGNYEEQPQLAIFLTGNRNPKTWNEAQHSYNFFDLKGIVDLVFQQIGLASIGIKQDEGAVLFLHKEIILGKISIVAQERLKQFDIKQPVFYAEIALNKLYAAVENNATVYQPLSKFPKVNRDLAIVVDDKTAYQTIKKTVEQLGIKTLIAIDLFDVFKNEKLGANKKSIALSFTFLDKEKTLTDAEIDAAMQKIVSTLEQNLDAAVRQ